VTTPSHRASRRSSPPTWIARAPEAAVLGLVALSLAASATVSLGIHRPWTTLPLALVVGWLLWRAVPPIAVAGLAARRAALWVVGGAAAWTVLGIALSSQYIVVSRDPGFLALSGIWLIDHPSTDIPSLGGVEAAATQANVIPDAWEAWNIYGDVIQPQGAKALPALLSVGGWLAGVHGVLAFNAIVGGVGVLAVFALARRMMKPAAAAASAGAFALTVSHIGLSRSPYSEPLTLLLIVAAVSWAWRGLSTRRHGPMIAAGIASGATALVRIDGAAYAVGVLMGIGLAAVARSPKARRLLPSFIVPQVLVLAAGYASLYRWSHAYLARLGDQALVVGAVYCAGLAVVVIVALVWGPRRHARTAAWVGRHRTHVASIAGWGTAAAVAVLASRPLWMVARRGTESDTDTFANSVVEAFQRLADLPIDPSRTYGESTLTWMSYYYTWPLMALAAVGLGVLAYRAVHGNAEGFAFLGAVAAPTAMYVVTPEIIPDQLWAIRRFEPITMPGLAIAAGVGAWWVAARIVERWPAWDLRAPAWAGFAMLALPMTTWISVKPGDEYPVAPAVYVWSIEQYGALGISAELCDVIDGRPVVLAGRSQYFGTIRVMCDVPEVLALVDPEPEALAQMAQIWGEAPIVLTQDPALVGAAADAPPIIDALMYRGEYALQHMPRVNARETVTWYAGIVQPDGSVEPVAPTSP